MDFLFEDDDDVVKETEEERVARKAKEEADREALRLRNNEERERGRQERLAKKKAEEDRWYCSKQPKVMDLEEYFERNVLLLSGKKEREYKEFIPQISKLFKKDGTMWKKMDSVRNQEDLEAFLGAWYRRVDLPASEMEHLDDWLAKYENQVFYALRAKTGVRSDSRSQRDFFIDLKAKSLQRKMREISAEDMSRKIEKAKEEKLKITAEETRKVFESLNGWGLREEFIEEFSEQSYNALQQTGPSSEPVPVQFSQPLRDAIHVQLADQFVDMNLSQPNHNSAGDDDDDDTVQSVVVEHEIPELWDWTRSLPDNPQKSVNFEKATEAQREEHRRRRFQDTSSTRVRFVDFESPKNRMRVFMKPNGYITTDADDGPTTNYVDLSLKDDHKALEQFPPPHTVWPTHVSDQIQPRYMGRTRLTVFNNLDWLNGYSGNLLGRFWCIRKDVVKANTYEYAVHTLRCIHGLLHDYSESDVHELYSSQLDVLYKHMRRSTTRGRMPISGQRHGIESDPIKGVLLLTDWRLLFLQKEALLNTCVRFMPTNIGDTYFDSMGAFLVELLNDPNIEIHTLIFAFGGSPSFNNEAFKRFWQKLIKETLKSVDVLWTAQDWCDGLDSSAEELAHLKDFNNYVKNIFEIMHNTGHRNYKFCDIKEKYKISTQSLELELDKNENPDVSPLQDLYFSYIDWFSSRSDFHTKGVYFTHNKRNMPSYKENSGRFPRKQDIFSE